MKYNGMMHLRTSKMTRFEAIPTVQSFLAEIFFTKNHLFSPNTTVQWYFDEIFRISEKCLKNCFFDKPYSTVLFHENNKKSLNPTVQCFFDVFFFEIVGYTLSKIFGGGCLFKTTGGLFKTHPFVIKDPTGCLLKTTPSLKRPHRVSF